jgi:hypothetical protein
MEAKDRDQRIFKKGSGEEIYMTALPPQLHCDHECVCWWYYDHQKSGSAAPCQSEKCHHRFIFAPTESEVRKKVLDEVLTTLENTDIDKLPRQCFINSISDQHSPPIWVMLGDVVDVISELRNKPGGEHE